MELFGMARLLAKTRMVDLELARPATLGGIFSSLAEKLPNLVGRVIDQSKGSLIGACACNVNGLEFVRDPAAEIRSGDRILILSADAGG
ncbi:MAG: MoaD/ThiS family protein [Candidatus Rokuibacteriota bacterium]